MFFNKWVDKQTVVYLYIGVLFSNKKKWTMKPWNDMGEP